MGKHTPGPWFVNGKESIKVTGNMNVIQTHSSDGLGYHVAYASGWVDDKETAEEARCNANLIASAPDLLEALEGIIADEGRGWAAINPPRTEAAKAAIAKAKGES
ncbi:hypothetical protein R0L47_13540 [Pectobacterium polonicum]|uniref:hypothetical protein n=1 Tax=Pectobacterium polonicum TaxID=2485124 RepID=UPI0010F89331|nr:hypothetical protein [Pectobacterium polonicum]TKY81063.1 hypothetical protein EDI29_17820 [Pectobacterium polonicum]